MSFEMTKLRSVFENKSKPYLSIFFTAGFPELQSTNEIYLSLAGAEVDFVEIGFPFSDPIADGGTIQKSSEKAIDNGMNLELLFENLLKIKDKLTTPIILMGYLNPALRLGRERFLEHCYKAGVSGLILPDLPLFEYEKEWKEDLDKYGISLIFLVTPQTPEERIRKIDSLSTTFIYAVSSQSVTGGVNSDSEADVKKEAYFKRLSDMKLDHPVIAGFGIHDKQTFGSAVKYLDGAIIGSAFIRLLEEKGCSDSDIKDFVKRIRS